MDRLLPPEVCWRRENVGGTVPRSKWLGFLAKNSGHIRELLGRRRLRIADIVNRKGLASNFDALIKTAASPLTSDMSGLFRLVNLELWYDNIARIRASGS